MSTNSTEKWSWQTWQHQHSLLSYKLSSPETHRCLNRCRYTLILQCSLFPTPKWRLPHHNGYYQRQKLHLMDISLCFCRALNFRINRNGQGKKIDLMSEKPPNTIDRWSLIQSKCCYLETSRLSIHYGSWNWYSNVTCVIYT